MALCAPLPSQRGFTLLEVLIAFSLIVIVIFVTTLTQGQGLLTSASNKNVVIATNLARNLINEQELKHEGISFDRLKDKEEGQFESNKDFKWTIEYSKVEFGALTDILGKQMQGEKESGENAQAGTILRIFKEYLEKSVRRMKVTIEWPEGKGTSSQTFTQIIVNYDQELSLAI